ncbi:small acid-soluble spore protein O [Pseudalkalibacillus sp. Hm43]
MAKPKRGKVNASFSDKQAVQQSSEFDHEFANEPLTANERQNNKKRKKNQ